MSDRKRWTASGLRVALACCAALGLTLRSDAAPDASVRQLIVERLADTRGNELDMLTVEYPPGGSSRPHRHNAYVLVYVLEGSVEMQVAGQEAITVPTGRTFVERPDDIHTVSRNASQTVPAKILVVALKQAGSPLTEAAESARR